MEAFFIDNGFGSFIDTFIELPQLIQVLEFVS